ncbi:hypothetical protein BGZ47_010498, partial [Haplosporangium gracile]
MPRSSSSPQAGSGQAQLVGKGQAHQGATTTTTRSGSNALVSNAPLASGSNNSNFNGGEIGQGTTRTRYESKCHLE